jgi:hypothetical protein
VTATGGFGAHAFTISAGALPRGLTLAANGVISGTPSRAGRFPFTVRATDAEGSIGERAYTLVVLDRVRPVISRLRVTNRVFAPKRRPRARHAEGARARHAEAARARHAEAARARSSAARRGTRIRFRLSEAARVAITIQRRTTGKRRGGRCVRRTERLRNRRNCIRFVNRGRVIRFAGRAGANRRSFSGRFGRRALKAGRYRARVVATDMAGNRSRPKTVGFRIRRP